MDEDMIWNHFYGKSSLNLKTVLSFQTLLSISPHRTSAFHSKIAIWIPAAEDHPFCKDTYHATEPIEVHYRCPYLIIKILKLARFLKRNLLLYAGFLKRNLLLNFVLKTLPWSHRLFITSITPLNMVQLGTVLAWSRGHIDEHQINRKISPLHKKMVNLDLNEPEHLSDPLQLSCIGYLKRLVRHLFIAHTSLYVIPSFNFQVTRAVCKQWANYLSSKWVSHAEFHLFFSVHHLMHRWQAQTDIFYHLNHFNP